ncbi:hypothetical protein AB0K15_04345 [Amycolatopsis sp. NPDC049253]
MTSPITTWDTELPGACGSKLPTPPGRQPDTETGVVINTDGGRHHC